MIPTQLQIKNFLSYGSQIQTIDFEPHHLICLSGKNGHGKSALLDAITWAIWGNARKTTGASKADDGLLRLGQTHMMVSLECICNDTRYRIRREYIKGSQRGETRLYLGVYDPQEDRFRSLTETSTKETQQAIQNIVGLDYESFSNSVFIRQGQSNAFSRKSPKERKEILATILGLEQYERYKKRAQEHVKTIDSQIEQTQTICNQLDNDIEQKESIQSQHAECEQSLQQYTEKENTLLTRDKQLQETYDTYTQQYNYLKHLQERHQQITPYYEDQLQQLRSIRDAWKKTFSEQRSMAQTNLHDTYQKQKAYVQKLDAHVKQYNDAYEASHKAYNAAQERKQHLYEQFIDDAHNAHKTCTQHHARVQELEAKLRHYNEQIQSYEHEYAQYKSQMHELQQADNIPETDLTTLEHQFEKTLYKAGHIDGMQRVIQAQHQYQATHKRAQQLKRLDRAHNAAQTAIAHARSTWHEHKEKHEHIATHQQSVASCEEKLHAYISALLQLQQSHASIYKQYQNAYTEYRKWHDYAASYDAEGAFETILHNDSTYTRHIATMQEQQAIMQNNSVSKDTYDAACDELNTVYEQITQHANPQQTEAVQQERRRHISTIVQTLKKLKNEITSIQHQINQYPDIPARQKEIQSQLNECRKELEQIRQYKERIIQQKGGLYQQLESIQNKEKTYQEKQNIIKQYQAQREEYAHIVQAFSRDGIQSLLIENAIPEIEQEANILLRQLTDNQSQLFIESLRDLKSGKTKETLDIKISDAMGIRPYELFSGGEAFRIDFSIRVAISTLLARRAGTQLQTLIIDEGFGSQDEEGLHHIMDAIYKIQQHFAKIIIVSHLPALKDQFPTQFLIHKGPQGSSIHVHSQG